MKMYSGEKKKGRIVEGDVHDYKGLTFAKASAKALRKKDRQESKETIKEQTSEVDQDYWT